MSDKSSTFYGQIFLLFSFLLLILAITHQAFAECVQGDCDNGYGIFIYEDGRIYEGQWKNGAFDGIGSLTFQTGSNYAGEFKKGLMHGYGQITLKDGNQQKCSFNENIIENNDSLKSLWETETKSSIEEYIFYCNMGDAYKKYENYEKAIEYYNKSLKVDFPQ